VNRKAQAIGWVIYIQRDGFEIFYKQCSHGCVVEKVLLVFVLIPVQGRLPATRQKSEYPPPASALIHKNPLPDSGKFLKRKNCHLTL
jgi:hypothetical protein